MRYVLPPVENLNSPFLFQRSSRCHCVSGLHAAGPRLPGAAPGTQRSRLAGAGSLQPATSAQLDAAESGPLGARFHAPLLRPDSECSSRDRTSVALTLRRDGFVQRMVRYSCVRGPNDNADSLSCCGVSLTFCHRCSQRHGRRAARHRSDQLQARQRQAAAAQRLRPQLAAVRWRRRVRPAPHETGNHAEQTADSRSVPELNGV